MPAFTVNWDRAYQGVEQRHCGRVANAEAYRNRDVYFSNDRERAQELADRAHRDALEFIDQMRRGELQAIEAAKVHTAGIWSDEDLLRGVLQQHGQAEAADIVAI